MGLWKIVRRHALAAGIAHVLTPARSSAFVCHSPSRARSGPPRPSGHARARGHFHDSDLHSRDERETPLALRAVPSPGMSRTDGGAVTPNPGERRRGQVGRRIVRRGAVAIPALVSSLSPSASPRGDHPQSSAVFQRTAGIGALASPTSTRHSQTAERHLSRLWRRRRRRSRLRGHHRPQQPAGETLRGIPGDDAGVRRKRALDDEGALRRSWLRTPSFVFSRDPLDDIVDVHELGGFGFAAHPPSAR